MSQMFFRVAKRWIAGQEASEALEVARASNRKGVGVMLNHLGEDITDMATVDAHMKEYLSLQKMIHDANLDACLSVKLTQLGLGIDEKIAYGNVRSLAEQASEFKQFLWLDMEGSRYTEATVRLYLDLLGSFTNVGMALQAYMRRSEADLEAIISKGGKPRLCKGAYREPPDVVFRDRKSISDNYVKLMGRLFESGARFAVATHDSRLIEEARRLAQTHKADFEFQMLKGIRDELKDELVAQGFRVVSYLPYGHAWYQYSKRRMTEHPSNIWLLLRSVV